MRTLIIDNGSFFLKNLKGLFDAYSGGVVTVLGYSAISTQKEADFDLIVLSGGHHKVTDHADDLYKEEVNLVLSGRTPILGICLGMELIAYAHGAQLNFLGHKDEGPLKVDIIKNGDPIFKGVDSPIWVYESHKYSVSKLPKEIVELAKSQDGPEIIKHTSKPIYGFQFHPEMDPENPNSVRLFQNTIHHLTHT